MKTGTHGIPAPVPVGVEAVMVYGGRPLQGAVTVEGCKISSVNLMMAALLTDDVLELEGAPRMLDHQVIARCVENLGGLAQWEDNVLRLGCRAIVPKAVLEPALLGTVHGTLYLLPALLVRNGAVSFPRLRAGCRIGVRPVDHILDVLRAFGAQIRSGPRIEASLPASGLRGATLDFYAAYGRSNNKYISGATKTALIAAVLARGDTLIRGAYWRWPIRTLCDCLRQMGAEIEIAGPREIRVRGVGALRGTRYRVPHDRLVLGTYIGCCGITRGRIECQNATSDGLEFELEILRKMGLHIVEKAGSIEVAAPERLREQHLSTETVCTDLGPIFAVLMSLAEGKSSLEEVIWERRFGYANQLRRLGASNRVVGRTLHITGVRKLKPAAVVAPDLRAGAALLMAALACEGPTTISGLAHLRRGYENLPGNLRTLGAEVTPVSPTLPPQAGSDAKTTRPDQGRQSARLIRRG